MWCDAVLACDLDRAVRRAVVDDEPLDVVEPGDLAREVAQGDGERLLLVQAGDLDDQLHGQAPPGVVPGEVQSTIGALMSRLRQEGPALAVLGLILAAGLVLRVLHNDHGLPYVYYVDEGSHFTKRAIEVFRDPNPGYFQNPSAYTYLLHAVYRLAAIPAGGSEAVIDALQDERVVGLRGQPDARRAALPRGRRRGLRRRPRAVGPPHRPARRRRALLRLPAGRLQPHGADRHGDARARRRRALDVDPHRPRAAACARPRSPAPPSGSRSASSTRRG